MSEQEEYYGPPMSTYETTRLLQQHDRDLYRGNGKPGVTTRLSDLENYQKRTAIDLYDPEIGIVQEIRDFLAVQSSRAKESSSQLARWGTGIAVLAVGTPIVWDYIKHSLGWIAK